MSIPGSKDLHAAKIIMDWCPSSLQISGGTVRRTSSRWCFGVEHGDYNGANLLGVGVDRYIWFGYRPNQLGRHRLFSVNMAHQGVIEFEPGSAPYPCSESIAGSWARFPFGIDCVLRDEEYTLQRGIDGVIFGDIPGGGMSRSASLTLNILLSILDANNVRHPPRMRIAEWAQRVETDYVGAPCGLLDQVMILFSRRDTGTHFNPVSRSIRFVPLPQDAAEFRLILLDTGTERQGLEKSTYPIRRAECAALLDHLRASGIMIHHLAAVRDDTYRQIIMGKPALPPHLLKRLRYIYQAVRRFELLLAAWQAGDMAMVGRIFRVDGLGLRYDYEISGPELDTICDIARNVPGILGERMLGGGDKGAAGAIARPEAVAPLAEAICREYPKHHPSLADKVSVSELRTADGVTVFRGLLR